MWSKLHGRKNDYILVINFKTFLAAIMCLWLPWMKARHSLEFSQNPFMIYNMAKFILTKVICYKITLTLFSLKIQLEYSIQMGKVMLSNYLEFFIFTIVQLQTKLVTISRCSEFSEIDI